MLYLRVISALIGIPILLAIIIRGGLTLAFALLILMIIGTIEFKNMIQLKGIRTLLIPLVIGEVCFVLGSLVDWQHWFSFGLAVTMLIIMIFFIVEFPNLQIKDVSANLLVLIYIGWTLTHIMLISNLPNGNYLLFFLFIIIWSTDTGAYFAGRFFGNRKLAPLVSPNKTIAGAVGGLILSAIIAIIFNNFFHLLSLMAVILISILISVVGQIGDLIESGFKRLTGVKDSGNIIPGHGGVLDRFDSILIAAPVMFYLILLLDKLGWT